MRDFHYQGIMDRNNGSDKSDCFLLIDVNVLMLFFFRRPMDYGLFILDIICLFIKNCIHFAVTMYFVSHCEMVVFYCKAIRTRLEEKSIPFLEAMKQILDLKTSISELNSAVSRMMSILIVYFLDRILLGNIYFKIISRKIDHAFFSPKSPRLFFKFLCNFSFVFQVLSYSQSMK